MINSMQLFCIVLAITIGMASGFPITPTEESTVDSPLETNTPANSHRKDYGLLAFYEDYLEQDSSREKLQDNQRSGEKLRTRQQSRQKLQDRQRSGDTPPANQETDAVPSLADQQDVPMWLLCLIMVATSGILVLLLVGCAFCTLTCLKRRSKTGGIEPMLEAVIIDNKQLQEEQTHFYFPSREEMKQLVREAFEQE